ncbi:MAG: hypothetical protein QOC98_3023 [Frankiaceae bacterium]|nr:hypothetical protein [Frankiaceae bacterium]
MKTHGRFLPDTDAAEPGVQRYVTMAGRCYSPSGVSSVLRCSTADVLLDVSRFRLLALGGEQAAYLFPVWQFPHGRRLPHLTEVLGALAPARMDPLSRALWFTRPRRELDGSCVAGWLQHGDPEVALALAGRSVKNGHLVHAGESLIQAG